MSRQIERYNPFDDPADGVLSTPGNATPGNPFDDDAAAADLEAADAAPAPSPFNPFDAPPPLASTNPFGDGPDGGPASDSGASGSSSQRQGVESHLLAGAAASRSRQESAALSDTSSSSQMDPSLHGASATDGALGAAAPSEHAAADMLRVLLRRAEPAAKTFLRSLRQAEERERRASLPTSGGLGGLGGLGGPVPRVSKAAGGLLRGIKAATAGLESKFKSNAAKDARWTPPFSKR